MNSIIVELHFVFVYKMNNASKLGAAGAFLLCEKIDGFTLPKKVLAALFGGALHHYKGAVANGIALLDDFNGVPAITLGPALFQGQALYLFSVKLKLFFLFVFSSA